MDDSERHKVKNLMVLSNVSSLSMLVTNSIVYFLQGQWQTKEKKKKKVVAVASAMAGGLNECGAGEDWGEGIVPSPGMQTSQPRERGPPRGCKHPTTLLVRIML